MKSALLLDGHSETDYEIPAKPCALFSNVSWHVNVWCCRRCFCLFCLLFPLWWLLLLLLLLLFKLFFSETALSLMFLAVATTAHCSGRGVPGGL